MIIPNYYLDKRAIKKDGTAPIKIRISKNKEKAYLSTGISVNPDCEWNGQEIIKHTSAKLYNLKLRNLKTQIEEILFKLKLENSLNGSIYEIRDHIDAIINPKQKIKTGTFYEYFIKFMDLKSGRTKEIYDATLNHIKKFIPEDYSKLNFEDITVDWINRLDINISKTSTSKNARNIHLRNIRAVFNYAIDNEATTLYPFRRFKIKSEPTKKRNLPLETIRAIISMDNLFDWEVKYRDFFVLSFMLIGINVVDLCNLKEINNGRIDYIRAKTHKQYSVKLEPEILTLLDKYKGEKNLLNFMDTYSDYRNFYNNLVNGLNSIRDKLGLKELTTYWARHSWATIARKIGISKDTIRQALGHGSPTVTDIYIEEDYCDVDEANRKVLDWVLYGKK